MIEYISDSTLCNGRVKGEEEVYPCPLRGTCSRYLRYAFNMSITSPVHILEGRAECQLHLPPEARDE